MQIRNPITPAVLSAATALLQPYAPDLSPRSLVDALKGYESDKATSDAIEKPLTRHEVASLLGMSLNSVNRYLNSGKLIRIKLTPRTIRIDPQSVRNLLGGNSIEA
ncbi:MAG: hypothetical protein VB042_10520 [Victivallaceae bacterium]|nr:hypothetical protein [Victivallaceae bacterium]